MEVEDLSGARLSLHALTEMAKRGISESEVREVLLRPDRHEVAWPGRLVLTSPQQIGSRRYALRVFVDTDRSPPTVVTA